MNHADLVALIRGGVPSKGGRWADLGAGDGAFTLALADVLGPGAQITALDKDAAGLVRLEGELGRRYRDTELQVVKGDFSRPLALHDIDGVVMANSLHFLKDKRPALSNVYEILKPGGHLIVVEYGADRGNPWVPHPFSYPTWEEMAAEAGFVNTRLLETIPSRFLGSIYSALSERPT